MQQHTASPTSDTDDLSYEQARTELIEVVQRLEQGSASLEDSLTLWERGEALANRCQTWLDSARERLRVATASEKTSTSTPTPSKEQD